MTQPSGWYDDPQDPTQVRYWDGVVWTERVTPKINPNVERSTIGSPRPPETTGGAPGSAGGQQASPWASPGSGHQQQGGSQPGQGPWQQPGQAPGQQPGYGPYGQGRPAYGARPTTPDGQPLSGWWRRVLARILDAIIIAVISIPFTFWAYGPVEGPLQQWVDDVFSAARAGASQTPPIPDEVARYVAIISLITFALYGIYEVFFLSRTGATPGKKIAGISVRLRDHPGPISAQAVLRRYAVKEGGVVLGLVPVIGLFASLFQLVNYLWPLWDSKKQALHDKVVATNVVLGPQPKREPRR